MPVEARAAHEPDLDFDRLPVLSQVETDRFCEGCGYNLRMQGVRRDPRLNILLVRCPECNRYHPVSTAGTTGQVWWQRIAGALTAIYVLSFLGLLGSLFLAQVGIMAGSLDELNHGRWTPGLNQITSRLYERPDDPDYLFLMVLASVGSWLTGYVAVASVTILCHHWQRLAYIAWALALPLATGMTLWVMLEYAPISMRDFAYRYVAWFTGVLAIGGLLAVRTGRPLARGIIRLLVPPGHRVYVAFLWSADGLEPPKKKGCNSLT